MALTATPLIASSGPATSAVAAEAPATASPDPNAAPSTRPAAGPEAASLAGSRPVSGKNPQAGPQFKQADGVWNVIAPEVVLRNTVSDPDGDRVNLSFEVWTTDASGNAKDRVKISDANQYGIGVSEMVNSGQSAQFKVDYGRLKPGVTYTFHTSAYDGTLYETVWSPWTKFRVTPYATFPAPQSSSTIDPVAQKLDEFTRTDPGPGAALKAEGAQSCSQVDKSGRKLCIRKRPSTESEKRAASASRAAAGEGDLIPWCATKTVGYDYMSRTEACMRSLGSADLVFLSSDPEDPPLGIASFRFEQRLKAYPSKSDSGSDFAEFDQQLLVTPSHIDSALRGVNLYWQLGTSCSTSCDVSPVRWQTYDGSTDDGRWSSGEEGLAARQTANSTVKWTGTGKEIIDLDWSVTGSVDVSELRASADFGTSGIDQVRELAPRCDDILKTGAPGCVLPFFKPTYTVDTNLYPAAGAYYWLMQEKMPDHAGSYRWDSLLHYLGPDTTATNPNTGAPWTSDNSRQKVCGNWTAHPSDASVGSVDCDEYAMASTHESGGFPGGVNQVSSGDQCAQLFTEKMGDGSANFGLLADTRKATNGPTGTERCGRAAISSTQNQQAFHRFPAPSWRMLDGDDFFVSNPGFEHCANAATTCAWRKIS